jgi:hypothetical protein
MVKREQVEYKKKRKEKSWERIIRITGIIEKEEFTFVKH